MNCKIDFIDFFILNYLASNVNLFIFNCLTLNINLFIFCLRSTQLLIFEVLWVPELWGTLVKTISVGNARKFMENKRGYKVRNFIVSDWVCKTSHTFLAQDISLFSLATRRIQTIQRGFHSESMEAIREPCAMSSSRRGIPAY